MTRGDSKDASSGPNPAGAIRASDGGWGGGSSLRITRHVNSSEYFLLLVVFIQIIPVSRSGSCTIMYIEEECIPTLASDTKCLHCKNETA